MVIESVTARRRPIFWAFALALALAAWPVRAQEAKDTEGVVLALDAGDVVIDLGKKAGLHDGDVLEVWRPLKLKNPATGKIVTDRFQIGSVKVTQVGEVMSLARPNGPMSRAIAAGDVVLIRIVSAPPPPKPVTSAKPLGSASPAPVFVDADPELREVGALFESLSGTSPEARVKAYEAWIKAHPKSRFAGMLEEEVAALRAGFGKVAPPPSTTVHAPVVSNKPEGPRVTSWRKLEEALENAPITFALELDGPVNGVLLQMRGADEPAFTPIPFTRIGEHFWSVTIPASRVRAPAISWFVEAVGADGVARPMLGTASENLTTKIVATPRVDKPLVHENTLSVWTDYADYDRNKGKDYAWQTEGWFGMRFGDRGVRAVRSGFGVYRGKGGSVDDLDTLDLNGRSVGLSYGYIEGEFGIDSFWGIAARAVAGLGADGVTGGAQAFVRIGNDKKTNLLLGGEFLGGVGLRGITQLELAIFPRVPIMVRSEVTNQPAGTAASRSTVKPGESTGIGDLGVRAIVQIGYRITPGFAFFLRGSYQGRTITHAGPGVGAGVSVTW
ncbi:MAG: hypothetical protein ACXVEE_26925 [Polyangiales bacterium]